MYTNHVRLIPWHAEDDKDHKVYEQWKVLEVVNCHQTKQYKAQLTYISNWDE